MCGGVLPVRHVGSVDVFLEAFSREMSEIRLPLFSLGTIATGPLRLDARPRDVFEFANVGEHRVSQRDIVVADADGVLFLPADRIEALVASAFSIRETEERQAKTISEGGSLREQLKFREYLTRRNADAGYSFRQHLRTIGGAIEE